MFKKVPIIAANWKMHKTGVEAEEFIRNFKERLPKPSVQVFIAPSFTILSAVVQAAQGSSLMIGAQNMHEASEGAFTGEISAKMLKAAGARFVILGHSERRRLFHETDERIHLKLNQAILNQILPVLCLGETLEERESGKTPAVLEYQIKAALNGLEPADLVLAYEPVWAIGTGKTATPEMAAEAHHFCRDCLAKLWGQEPAKKISILYGGSVTPETAPQLAAQSEIDGALVGGASLDVAKLIQIIQGFSV